MNNKKENKEERTNFLRRLRKSWKRKIKTWQRGDENNQTEKQTIYIKLVTTMTTHIGERKKKDQNDTT